MHQLVFLLLQDQKNNFIDNKYFEKIRIFDGGMGQELLSRGLDPQGTLWSARALLEQKYHSLIQDIHEDFIKAGSEVIVTNTFTTRKGRLKENNLEDKEYLKILKFYLHQLNQENFDFVFYIAGVDIHFNDRLGKLKVSDEGIRKRDEIVTENFFSKGIPLCGVLGGGYNKDSKKLVELHSYLHQSCAKLV